MTRGRTNERAFSRGRWPVDTPRMQRRFVQLLLAELLAFVSFVFGGLALLGGLVTWSGDSQHHLVVSWSIVAVLAILAIVVGRVAAFRLRLVFTARAEHA